MLCQLVVATGSDPVGESPTFRPYCGANCVQHRFCTLVCTALELGGACFVPCGGLSWQPFLHARPYWQLFTQVVGFWLGSAVPYAL
jgi:hypothetical protein